MQSKGLPVTIVAYFDFDGTLTYKDTLVPFIIYCIGIFRFICKLPLILPVVILFLLKIINNEQAKQKFLQITIKGLSKQFLENKAKNFALTKLDSYLKPEIYTKLEYHLEHKHLVIIVSANLSIYLRYWVQKHNLFNVIGTEIEFKQLVATGKLATKNCYGIEKINRINSFLKYNHLIDNYKYAYGNSKGDYELLEYANESYYIMQNKIINWNEMNAR